MQFVANSSRMQSQPTITLATIKRTLPVNWNTVHTFVSKRVHQGLTCCAKPASMTTTTTEEKRGVENFNPLDQGHIVENVKCYDKVNAIEDVPHVEAAWEWFAGLGKPKLWVAPMVDQSELAFRMLCKTYGADAAYTPMLHARLFNETPAYREEHFLTCPEEDRPLLAQFCANDPDILLAAARYVEPYVDGVDINLGCPQRIARKGRYGAFLMDDIALIESLVRKLAENLSVPVTVKIRRFPDIRDTVEYAARLEKAGACLVAVHGRLREEKRSTASMACWETIAAVKRSLHVPVLANGNLRNMFDVQRCLELTGADGVMSAESLLEDPAMFSPKRLLPGGEYKPSEGPQLLLEYCDWAEKFPPPYRMVRGHAFSLLGSWLSEFIDMREELRCSVRDIPALREFTGRLIKKIEATGRDHPIPAVSQRRLKAMEAEAAKQAAIQAQEEEEQALAALDLDV